MCFGLTRAVEASDEELLIEARSLVVRQGCPGQHQQQQRPRKHVAELRHRSAEFWARSLPGVSAAPRCICSSTLHWPDGGGDDDDDDDDDDDVDHFVGGVPAEQTSLISPASFITPHST